MIELKAFIHRNRIADVIHKLHEAGFQRLSVIDVKGILKSDDVSKQEYSIEIGEEVVTEAKLEVICGESRRDVAIRIIRDNARTGKPQAGCIYVSEISDVYEIDEV
ncbi:MAG: P-II family nitrogen regulator [Gammaproteobacteria bacterium]